MNVQASTCSNCGTGLILKGQNGAAQYDVRHVQHEGHVFCNERCLDNWLRVNYSSCEVYDPRHDPDIGDMA